LFSNVKPKRATPALVPGLEGQCKVSPNDLSPGYFVGHFNQSQRRGAFDRRLWL
jgi:hypothetical protein